MPEIPDPIDAYTKAEVDASQAVQDEIIDLKAPQETTYTKAQIDSSQGAQDAQIASKAPQATTYTKTEVDASQGAQDTKIAKNLTDIATNKADIKTNKDNIAKNKGSIEGLAAGLASANNDIIELEEEIEALAPSFDRGHWAHDPDTTYPRAPLDKHYYVIAGVEHADKFEQVTEIFFSNNDSDNPSHTHTFNDVEVGQMIEVFEGSDSSFMLAKITEKTVNDTYTVFKVDVIKAEGGPGVEEEEPENPDVLAAGAPGVIRVKFFTMSEGEVNLDGFMPKAGGTFTGTVKHKKDIFIEPTLPNTFVNIKNRYTTNSDGTPTGNDANGTGFGLNFDLDHGNSGYNQVKWTTRNGDILNISGGSRAWAKYRGEMTEDLNLVNKLYVDNAIKDSAGANSTPALHTLTSAGNTMKYVSGRSLNDGQFSASSTNMGSNKTFYFYKLYDAKGASATANSYEATDSTMLEIWSNGNLVVKTTLKDWKPSTYSSGDRQATISGFSPMTFSGSSLNTSVSYGIVLSGLKKKA